MVFAPYAVDVPMSRWPYANWALLGVNVVVSMMVFANPALEPYVILSSGEKAKTVAWIGCLFAHGDFFHLLGNMIFLWVFGNAVCAKIGHLPYLGLYLAGGIASDVAHKISSPLGLIGASGAINAVVGAYLLLFPLNYVRCYFIIVLRIITYSVPGWVAILTWFVFDVWGMASGAGRVGYAAHLGGFLFGAGVMTLALKRGWVVMDRAEKSLLQAFGWMPVEDRPSTWRDRAAKKSGEARRAAAGGRIPPPRAPGPATAASTAPATPVAVPRAASGAGPAGSAGSVLGGSGSGSGIAPGSAPGRVAGPERDRFGRRDKRFEEVEGASYRPQAVAKPSTSSSAAMSKDDPANDVLPFEWGASVAVKPVGVAAEGEPEIFLGPEDYAAADAYRPAAPGTVLPSSLSPVAGAPTGARRHGSWAAPDSDDAPLLLTGDDEAPRTAGKPSVFSAPPPPAGTPPKSSPPPPARPPISLKRPGGGAP